MTEALYQNDSYCCEFSARVTAQDTAQDAIQLDRTAFYSGGGGQPHDVGWLWVGEQALEVRRVNRGHWHALAEGAELPAVGETVRGEIDWARRYALMRTHTAMHILCGVIWRDYGASVTGGNMQPLDARMDFEFARMQKELVVEIEAKINAEVAAERAVRVRILPRAEAFAIPDLIRTKINLLPAGIEQVRTVELVGLDLQADGGTHVANTREVGRLRIRDYKSKGGINKRLYIALDEAEEDKAPLMRLLHQVRAHERLLAKGVYVGLRAGAKEWVWNELPMARSCCGWMRWAVCASFTSQWPANWHASIG